MKRFDTDVSAFDSALEQTPKVFESVRVNMPFRVALGVVDNLVRIFVGQAVVGHERISINGRTFLDVLSHFAVQLLPSNTFHDLAAHPRNSFAGVTLQKTKHCDLANASTSALTFASMHVSGLAADIGLIGLDAALHFLHRAVLHRKTDAVKHEPRGLLRDSNRAVQFVGTDSVFGVSDEPESAQPFVQLNRRIFQYCSY